MERQRPQRQTPHDRHPETANSTICKKSIDNYRARFASLSILFVFTIVFSQAKTLTQIDLGKPIVYRKKNQNRKWEHFGHYREV